METEAFRASLSVTEREALAQGRTRRLLLWALALQAPWTILMTFLTFQAWRDVQTHRNDWVDLSPQVFTLACIGLVAALAALVAVGTAVAKARLPLRRRRVVVMAIGALALEAWMVLLVTIPLALGSLLVAISNPLGLLFAVVLLTPGVFFALLSKWLEDANPRVRVSSP